MECLLSMHKALDSIPDNKQIYTHVILALERWRQYCKFKVILQLHIEFKDCLYYCLVSKGVGKVNR